MPTSVLPSTLRTLVPLAVGYFAAWPVAKALGLTDEQVTSLITAVITAAYYLAVRGLEQVAPQFGWLLGYASKPVYDRPATPTGERGTGELGLVLIAAAAAIVVVTAAILLGLT